MAPLTHGRWRRRWAPLVPLLLLIACTHAARQPQTLPSPTGPSSAVPATASRPPSIPTATPEERIVTAAGTRLRPPGRRITKPYDPDPISCELLDSGWHGGCQRFRVETRELGVALQERERADGRWDDQVRIYRRTGAQWLLVLQATRVIAAGSGANTDASVSDLARDGARKLVVTTGIPAAPGAPSGRITQLDVVEATGTVVLHTELRWGIARRAPQPDTGLITWSAASSNPYGAYQRTVIRYRGGAWRASAEQTVQPRDLPPPPDPHHEDPDAL